MDRPLTKQDLREGSPTYGATAVKLPDNSPLGEWGYMTLDRGGGFLTAAQVAAWTDTTP